MTGVHLGGESDAEMEELLPGVDVAGEGGGMFEDESFVGGGDHRPTLVPSESLVVQL